MAAFTADESGYVLVYALGPDEVVLWLALGACVLDETFEVLLNTLVTGPVIATKSGRMTGRQAQSMPTQGSAKESMTAGASVQSCEAGSPRSREVKTQRMMEATRSLRCSFSYCKAPQEAVLYLRASKN